MPADVPEHWRLFVDGGWTEGEAGAWIEVLDPATGERLASVARADEADVDRAVQAAHRCAEQRRLVDMRPSDRGRALVEVAFALRARADAVARLLTLDSGKPVSQSRAEVEASARYFEYYGGQADKLEGRYIPLGAGVVDYTIPEPYGVSAQIVPWNFPLEMTARSLAPALAAGNAVVVKLPELDPLAPLLLGELFAATALPDGAVNLVCGYGRDAGHALVRHPLIDQIVFTGSVATGRDILHAAADRVLPTVMELGGKSAGVVFADADLGRVVEATRWGIFFNSGQSCNAMSRLLVQRSIHDQLVERLRTMTGALTVGPGIEEAEITPVISAAQLERVEGFCRRAANEGANAVAGGARLEQPGGGFYMAPTVFAEVQPQHEIAREEVFGPVLVVLPFADEAEAIALANGTEYGLAAGVFTRDLDRAHRAAARLKAGQVYVNDWFTGGVETPFGGYKRSGFGREKGQEALLNYVQSKNVGVRLGPVAAEANDGG